MHYAARKFLPSFLRLLLAHGADLREPCAEYHYGALNWPVHTLAYCRRDSLAYNTRIDGALEALDTLIAAGAEVDACPCTVCEIDG